MYVCSGSMPTVVELNGAESTVCIFFARKYHSSQKLLQLGFCLSMHEPLKNNEYLIFQVNF